MGRRTEENYMRDWTFAELMEAAEQASPTSAARARAIESRRWPSPAISRVCLAATSHL